MSHKDFNQRSLADSLVTDHKALHDFDDIDKLINWQKIKEQLAGIHNKKCGNSAYPPLLMFKALLLQAWYSMSDSQLENALARDLLFRGFVGLSISSSIPDHSTIWRFRDLLKKHDLWLKLLNVINDELETQGYKIQVGEISIIDATVIEAQRCRKHQNADGEDTRDDEASCSVKKAANGKATTTYGFKAHTNVDEDGFIKKFSYTTGSVHDSQEFECLLTHKEEVVYADKAYDSKARRQLLDDCGIESKIQHRAARNRPLTPSQIAANKSYGMVRSRVERVFAQLKLHHGVAKARYLGIARNRVRFALCAIAHNLKCARGILYEMRKYDTQPQLGLT